MAEELINFELPAERSSIIKVIGVGGGGSNAVNHMYRRGIAMLTLLYAIPTLRRWLTARLL